MSRLEKARAEKKQGRKRSIVAVAIIVLVVLAAGTFYLLQDGPTVFFTREEPDLIDLEKTEAFIDIFQLTYVRVYLKDDVNDAEVTAGGEKISFNDEYDRWDTVLSGYEEGDELIITVVAEEDQELIQEITIIVEELEV
ncbi:MAG: hypothetical protein ACQES4_09695, partial [Bacillota bacterium]